jgi:hypothetical protein
MCAADCECVFWASSLSSQRVEVNFDAPLAVGFVRWIVASKLARVRGVGIGIRNYNASVAVRCRRRSVGSLGR